MLIFIDESGHPRPKDPTTRPVILAVCIREADVGRLVRATFGIRKNLLSALSLTKEEEEGKASSLLNRRALTKSASKREYVDSTFEFLRDFELTCFGIVMERPTQKPYEGAEFLPRQHRWLLERIERFMEKEHPKYMALPIFDGQDPASNRKLADCFAAFMARSVGGRALQHVVPTPLFVDSSLTPGIQIADWFAYVTRLNWENSLHQTTNLTDPYLSVVKRYANIVRDKTINFEEADGFTIYGIATMDATKFEYSSTEVAAEATVVSDGA